MYTHTKKINIDDRILSSSFSCCRLYYIFNRMHNIYRRRPSSKLTIQRGAGAREREKEEKVGAVQLNRLDEDEHSLSFYSLYM